MTEKDMCLMNGKDRTKLKVISLAVEKVIKQREAAEKLELSERQVRRLVRRYKKDGDKGLVHKLRGRPSARRISQEVVEEVIKKYAEKYKGFGMTLANEKFLEIEGIVISRETQRKHLLEAGLWEVSRKSKKHRRWRERMQCRGEMVQMDGSEHDWLEGRGPWMTLMGYIDDASGDVYGEFHDYEGTIPAMISFKGYVKRYGIPMKIYLDKHTTYKSPKKETIEEQLSGEKSKSQFERALGQVGVEVIHANSPQAKGRIERLFRTFQDRVIKEMRLANICNKDEANKFLRGYLPEFNRKFAVEPARKEDMHDKVVSWSEMNKVMTIRIERTVRNDYTIANEKKLYQLKTVLSLKGRKVTYVELLNGRNRIEYKGQRINFVEVQPRPKVKAEKRKRLYKAFSRPAKNHPWKLGYDNYAAQ